MKLKKPINENYAAMVVEIKKLVPLAKCDNIQAAIIMGQQVIVGKDVKIGDVGLYFPLETQLTEVYLSANNLYRKNNAELNSDKTKSGYFDINGRIRSQKLGKHLSEGLFMPLNSLKFTGINVGDLKIKDEFDEINGIVICRKYVVKKNKTPGLPGNKKEKNPKKYESKLIDNQFRFHQDTNMLYKNLHKIEPDTLISITYKEHGTSAISSKILCKKKLTWVEKFLIILGVNIIHTQNDYIYSSRKKIKNEELNSEGSGYYDEDIWGIAHNEIKDVIQDGMTLYYEIVGFTPNGTAIQKGFDYGCSQEKGEHKIKVYRITYTNSSGKVFEFSAKQVQQWCERYDLIPVKELFYGYASEFSDERLNKENWEDKFLETIKERYNEKDCYICKNEVPEEGVVIRVEGVTFEAYKQKSKRFYDWETDMNDKGVVDMESEN